MNSIGVSNFDIDLLESLASLADILPHVVQNHGEPGVLDVEVRRWAFENGVVYQPYATLRNLHSSAMYPALKAIADAR